MLCTMPDDVWAQGLGRVSSGFGSQTDLASVSGSLHGLVFHVQDLVAGGWHVARSDGKMSGETRGQRVQKGQYSQQWN